MNDQISGRSDLHYWLQQQTIYERELTDIAADFGRHLNAVGIPVTRMNIGGLLLHPVLGGLDITWDAMSGTCKDMLIPRAAVSSDGFRNAPFFNMVSNGISFERHRLDEGDVSNKYPLFQRLRSEGIVDYIALFESYGRKRAMDWAGLPAGVEGATVSFSTDRSEGFSEQDVSYLRDLSLPIAITVKAATERNLTKTLLDTYLGRLSGDNVLTGLMQRGDGRLIDCVLWRSDLRGSTSMAAELSIDEYFNVINDYFECTAGAVLDQGGEVLKFIGDAVMAIFPFDQDRHSPEETCQIAIDTSREAFSRVSNLNKRRDEEKRPSIKFGIGVHVGEVIFGNVGTEQRLDMTVTGPAANEVERLESMCKRLSVPLVASAAFDQICAFELMSLGHQTAAGLKDGVQAFTLPEYFPTNTNADT